MRLERIVVGVADVEREDPVLDPALALAAHTGAELHVVHVLTEAAAAARGAAASGRSLAASSLARRLSASGPRPRVHVRVRVGVPDQTLVLEARRLRADLLVVGPTRRGAIARAVLGTTAQQVLRLTEVPVLALRRPLPSSGLRAVLTTDLSPLSQHAHVRGLALLRELSGPAAPRLAALFVLNEQLGPADATRREEERRVEAEFGRFLAQHTPPDVEITAEVRVGDPANEILSFASACEADLVVVGTHARRGAARLLLGSVAEAVVRGAQGNVLVLPPSSVRSPAQSPVRRSRPADGDGRSQHPEGP